MWESSGGERWPQAPFGHLADVGGMGYNGCMKKILAEVTFGLGLFAVLGTGSLFAADTYLVVYRW